MAILALVLPRSPLRKRCPDLYGSAGCFRPGYVWPEPLQTIQRSGTYAELQPGSGAIVPYRIRIPVLGIDTHIESVGLYKGAMDVPGNIWDTAWLNSGPRPGESGNAVIDGHKDSVAGVAVFWRLSELKAGDKIYVSDRYGWELTFEVNKVASYETAQAPLEQVFGATTDHNLNLITCDGRLIRVGTLMINAW